MSALMLAALLWAPADAGGPCAYPTIQDGVVLLQPPLPVETPASEADLTCLDELGQALYRRSELRAVTVAVQAPDAQRVDGSAWATGRAYADRLVAAGLPAERVSVVVPAAGPDGVGQVQIRVAAQGVSTPMAVVVAAQGPVSSGVDPRALNPLPKGGEVGPNQLIQTGEGGVALLRLAEGSALRLQPHTQLLLGDAHVTADQRAEIVLGLLQGSVEAALQPGPGAARFTVQGEAGTAEARGASFRIHDLGGRAVRLETLAGTVTLTGETQTIPVDAGRGSQLATDQDPEPHRALLAAPKPRGAAQAAPAEGHRLSWRPVTGARSYTVELARDAAFTEELRREDAGQQTHIAAPPLDDGPWFWRVGAVDTQGFTGAWSPAQSVVIRD